MRRRRQTPKPEPAGMPSKAYRQHRGGITYSRLSQLKKAGKIIYRPDGTIDPKASDQAIEAARAIVHLPSPARAMRERYQARLARLEYQTAVGKVVEVELVCTVLERMLVAARSRLLALPVKLAPRLVGRTALEAKALLDAAVREALNEIAVLPFPQAKEGQTRTG